MVRNSVDSQNAQRERQLKGLSALVGLVLLLAAIAMFLSVSVTSTPNGDWIDGQPDTSSLLLPIGLFLLGGTLFAFGLDRRQ